MGPARAPRRAAALLLVRLVFVGALAFTLWMALRPPLPGTGGGWKDKVLHVGTFVVLAFLADRSFPTRRFGWREAAGLLGFGLLIEVLQQLTPPREASGLDLLADLMGVVAYAALSHGFGCTRVHAGASAGEGSAMQPSPSCGPIKRASWKHDLPGLAGEKPPRPPVSPSQPLASAPAPCCGASSRRSGEVPAGSPSDD